MDKIELFLNAQKQDLLFERNQLQDDLDRIQKQIRDLRDKMDKIKESKDRSYEVFSASHVGDVEDTEISAMEQLVSEKIHRTDELGETLINLDKKLAQLSELNYSESDICSGMSREDFLNKLQLIYKWIPVDAHRAQTELLRLIRTMEEN